MMFTVLINAVCLYNACLPSLCTLPLTFALLSFIQMPFVFMLCPQVIEKLFFFSIIILHHAQVLLISCFL